jgi:formylglycine-generating enzyme required for sulfatase activity
MKYILLLITTFVSLTNIMGQMNVVVNPFKKKGCVKCRPLAPKMPSLELKINSNINGYIQIEFDQEINKSLVYKSNVNIKGVTIFNESMHCKIDNETIGKKSFTKLAIGARDEISFSIDDQSLQDCEYEYNVLSFITDENNYSIFPASKYQDKQIPAYEMHKFEMILDVFYHFVNKTNYIRKITDADIHSTHLNQYTGYESQDRAPYSYLMSPTGDKYNLSRYHQDRYYPIVYVNQADISAFIEWLNGIDTEYEYRLPTSLEWEYAYIKDKDITNINPWGTETSNVEKYVNVGDLSIVQLNKIEDRTRISDNVLDSIPFICKYNAKRPQNNGLYHMIGNVAEWVSDYKEVNKGGKLSKEYIYKGGSFFTNINDASYQKTYYYDGDIRHGRIGFRICRTKRSVFERKK